MSGSGVCQEQIPVERRGEKRKKQREAGKSGTIKRGPEKIKPNI